MLFSKFSSIYYKDTSVDNSGGVEFITVIKVLNIKLAVLTLSVCHHLLNQTCDYIKPKK